MTGAEYRRLTEQDMVGRRWRTSRVIRNSGGNEIAAGTEVAVTRKFGGVTIRVPRCDHCGQSVSVSRVEASAIFEIRS